MNNRYSHCFTKCQLELIIDDYLGLQPYYKILALLIQKYVKEMTSKDGIHNKEKNHPIQIYTKDLNNKNIQEELLQPAHFKPPNQYCKHQLRTTYSQISQAFYFIYPLEVIISILESQDFYKLISKDYLINQLLTNQNIDIIVETLSIVSQQMSKKIKSTLTSKENQHQKGSIKKKPQQNDLFSIFLQIKQAKNDQIQSKVQIIQQNLFEDDEKPATITSSRKKRKNYTECHNRRQQSRQKLKYVENLREERQCKYCDNYKTYLSQINGYDPNDWCLDKLSKECIKYLIVISQAISHFTIYLNQQNITEVPNNINNINRILNHIGIVITEDIYKSQLNPKNQLIVDSSTAKPRTLIEHLSPYFNASEKKKKRQKSNNGYEIHELFKMIIYSPKTSEVSKQLKGIQIDQFEKQAFLLNNMQKNEKAKVLLKKQYEEMKQFEQARLQIIKNTIDIKPIYKQIHISEVPTNVISSKPDLYSLAVNKKTADMRFLENRNETVGYFKESTNLNKKKLNESNTIDIIAETTKTITDKFEDPYKSSKLIKTKNVKPKGEKIRNDLQHNIRRNLIPEATYLIKNNKTNATTSQVSQFNINPYYKNQEEDNELTDDKFKKMIKTLAKSKPNHNLKVQIQEKIMGRNNMSGSLLNKTENKGDKIKSSNIYSNSLSEFIVRKQQKYQIQCIQKMEKQLYNRQLLNGQFIRKQVYEEFWLGDAKLYDNHCDAVLQKKEIAIDKKQPQAKQSKSFLQSEESLRISNFSKRQRLSKEGNVSKNVIQINSRKYNNSGLIRNEKFSKNIKNELINNSSNIFNGQQSENISRYQLAQTKLRKKPTNQSGNDINALYNEHLNTRLKENTVSRLRKQ